MSPLCIRILLHYYGRMDDYQRAEREPHAGSIAVSEALQQFVIDGLLTSRFGDVTWACRQAYVECSAPLFTITDKGRAMVEALKAVKIPICKWVQP